MHLQKYRSMPHVFVIFENHPSTETCYNELGKFTKSVTTGREMKSRLEVVNGKGIIEDQPLNPENYPISVSKAEVDSFDILTVN